MRQKKTTRGLLGKRSCRVESLEGRYSPSSFFSPLAGFFADFLAENSSDRGGPVRIVELRTERVLNGLRAVPIPVAHTEHAQGSRGFLPRIVDEIHAQGDDSVRAEALRKISAARKGPRVATYEVTITNLTDGQPFSPPILATHRAATDIFTVGEAASVGIQQIAENGNNGPLREALGADRHVYDVQEASAPIVPAADPGGTGFDSSATLTITSARGAKFLSLSTMLICTNDGFTGVDSMRLPKKVGNSTTVLTAGYDAGTELNTEDFADMVPPCQGLIGISSEDTGTGMSNPELAEGGVISHHAGIMGGNDLVPGTHGWTDPVAEIVITRVS